VRVVLPLLTDRLTIRAFTPADQPAMQAMYADPEVMLHIDTRGEDPSVWVDAYIAHQRDHGYGFWAIEEHATGELIGEAGLAPFDGVGPWLELGYLLRRDRWGLGLGTEAAHACLTTAFESLHAREVRAVIDVGNDASLNVARKLGFRTIGRRRVNGRRQHILTVNRPPLEPVPLVTRRFLDSR
jgi:[ribosomal protein S5]-alanine N-acetyltransferase